jgi:hypothetical protein
MPYLEAGAAVCVRDCDSFANQRAFFLQQDANGGAEIDSRWHFLPQWHL